MNRIGDMFSSGARTEILRVLNEVKDGVGLRQAARMAGVHPHSAELVLSKLAEEDLVKSWKSGNRKIYALNLNHEAVSMLDAMFKAAADALIRARSKTLQERGRSILPFISDADAMLKRARRGVHVA